MDGPASPEQSGSPESIFAAWLAARESRTFDSLVREHSEHEQDLRELHRDWLKIEPLLPKARLLERLKVPQGEGVSAKVGLEVEDVQKAEVFTSTTSELLKRLATHTGESPRYKLEGEVARGAMGAILRVWDENLRRHLAMKVVLGREDAPSSGNTPQVETRVLARFLEEAQVTGQLDHPGIVPVHELGLDADGRVYFTMKLVKGRDLKAIFDLVFKEVDGWNQTRALGVILKACEAMAYAHKKGVIHRDLKPANVMVGGFGEVFVMDWGLARVLGRKDTHDIRLAPEAAPSMSSVKTERREQREDSPDSPIMTMDGDVVGTPAYMPPEQARGEIEKLTARSDVYSLGAMIYHLLAHHRPYAPPGSQLTNRTVLALVQQGPPSPLRKVRGRMPVELIAICEKAMAREAQDRYADTLALAGDLRAYLEGRVVRAHESGTWAETRKWIQRNTPLAASLVAVFVTLGLGASGFAWKAKQATILKEEAILRERDLLVRGLIQEEEQFASLGNSAEWARAQDRSAAEWWIESAHGLIKGQDEDLVSARFWRPGLEDVNAQIAMIESRSVLKHPSEVGSVAVDGKSGSVHDVSGEYAFHDQSDWWWYGQLRGLKAKLESLQSRLAVAERSVVNADAKGQWLKAISEIKASAKYSNVRWPTGDRLTPQLELVPIGPDPESGLWEFSHLPTGEPARRDDAGAIILESGTGLVFVLLPGGKVPIQNGVPETSLNQAVLGPFFLSKYEMTCDQWNRVDPEWSGTFPRGNNGLVPAHGLGWDDCNQALSQAGVWLSFPTEAQWEYACRGGTTTPWWTGAEESSLDNAESVNINAAPVLYGGLGMVGRLRANPFGLHDMHGSVREWCKDFAGSESDSPVHEGDGLRDGPLDGMRGGHRARNHVLRGGDSNAEGKYATSGYSIVVVPPDVRSPTWGLRPARCVTP